MKFDSCHAKASDGIAQQVAELRKWVERAGDATFEIVGAEIIEALADQLAETGRWISDTSDVSITRVEIDAESDESVQIAGQWVRKARPHLIVHDSYEAARGYMEAMMDCGAMREGDIVVRGADEP